MSRSNSLVEKISLLHFRQIFGFSAILSIGSLSMMIALFFGGLRRMTFRNAAETSPNFGEAFHN